MTHIRHLFVCVLFSFVLFIAALPAAAQPSTATLPDFKAWESVATRAENAIDADTASDAALERLREELVTWRERFQKAEGTNGSVISSTQAQLDALGPPPEDGSEADSVAQQRKDLEKKLSDLQAPAKKAELAYSRADSLVAGIDQIVRDRQKEAFLELGPSPLNPNYWWPGLSEFADFFAAIKDEIVAAWREPATLAKIKTKAPIILLLILVGVPLVARGRNWTSHVIRRVVRGKEEGTASHWLSIFWVSLGVLTLPLAGIYALTEAALLTELFGDKGTLFLSAIVPSVFIFLLARWVSIRIFPPHGFYTPLQRFDAKQRRAGRMYGTWMGVVVALFYILDQMAAFSDWSPAVTNVILFPVLVLSSLLLASLARLMGQLKPAGDDDQEVEESFRRRMMRMTWRLVMALAILAPILAAIGYFRAAQAIMLPTLLSLLLMACLIQLQQLVAESYALLSGNEEDRDDSLASVMIGFTIALLSLPFFALIWGARVAELTELWTKFIDGVELGGIRISPAIFMKLIVVFAAGYLITRILQSTLRNTILPKTRMDVGGREAITSGVGYVGIFLAALVAITSAGINLSSLAIVAGALSVGIGFGLQNIVSNFVSGIILLVERPISQGDWIEVGGLHGYVRKISVRSTRIETFDRSDVIVPNADLVSGTVTNYTRGNTVGRVIVPVGVAYGSDTREVEKILRDIAEAHPMVLVNPPPTVVFIGFGADSLDFEIRAILRDVNWVLSVKSDMNHEIAQKFTERSIEIPFAQRDVWLRNPETLTREKPKKAPKNPKPSAQEHLSESDFEDGDTDGDGDGDVT